MLKNHSVVFFFNSHRPHTSPVSENSTWKLSLLFFSFFVLPPIFHQCSVREECVQFQSLKPVVQPSLFLVDWSIRCLSVCLFSRCKHLQHRRKKKVQPELHKAHLTSFLRSQGFFCRFIVITIRKTGSFNCFSALVKELSL